MYETTYTDRDGTAYLAIQIPWGEIEALIGRPHNGHPKDDRALLRALRKQGSPKWINDAEGWTDEYGWGLIGPVHSDALRGELADLGISQRACARALGIDERTMRRYCTGEYEVPETVWLALDGLRYRANS